VTNETSNPILEIKNFSYELPNGYELLKNVNLKINKGEYVALLGANGSGKSTLIKIILGIIKNQSKDNILYNGVVINDLHRKNIAYLPQFVFSIGQDFPATVGEVIFNLENISTKIKQAKVLEILELLNVDNLLYKSINELSGGEKQKVFLARSLLQQPELIILDEPTVGIDQQSQTQFYELMKYLNSESKITILIISHDIGAVVKQVSKIFFLNQSITCFHNTSDFLKNDVLNNLYGENLHLLTHYH
jgi:zinc transport system ATP-binding protein